jgi:hypothetical protein
MRRKLDRMIERGCHDPPAATAPGLGALQGHFEAHGRDLDLREAFARDPGRFEAPSACRRPRSSPTCRRT